MALGFIIGFVVGAAVVLFFLSLPLADLSKEERKELEYTIKMALLRKYKQ